MFVTVNASMTTVIGPYFTVTTLADVLHTHLIIDANTHPTSDLMSGMTTLPPDYRHLPF